MAVFTGTILVWQAVESSWLRPDYLTYFNQIAGGPKNGYRHLVDSSLDWGQDLPALKRWLDQHPEQSAAGRLYLAYFGTGSPVWYGINATSLPVDPFQHAATPLEPGLYCISATTLQQVYSFQHGKWTREYEAEYRLALTQAVHRGDLTTNESGTNNEALQRLRFARLCSYLRQREPLANVGNSILVFQLSQQELDQALYGPPPELASESAH